MSSSKRENLLKKIESLSEKIEGDKERLRKLELELEELDKDKIYQAIKFNGLTVEQAEKVLTDYVNPANQPKKLIPLNTLKETEKESKNEEDKNEKNQNI